MFSNTILALSIGLPLALSIPLSQPLSSVDRRSSTPAATLYFLQNHESGNEIVSFQVPTEGNAVAEYVITSTGGKGQRGLLGPGMNAGPDSLFGQGSVAVSREDNLLFTVNPGSNTVSMFAINPAAPMLLDLVGEPADTLGDFPMSVTYSSALKTACVLNGGHKSGVSCFSVSAKTGLTALSKTAYPLPSGFNQTTPPLGPPNTASQISFSPDNSYLVATLKGNFAAKTPTAGWTTVWPVSKSGGKVVVSASPVTTSSMDLLGPFGFGFLGKNNDLLISDPTHGASVMSMSSSTHKGTIISTISLKNFSAACWATTTPDQGTGFVIDAGTTQIAVVDGATNSLSGIVKTPDMAKGGFDAVSDEENLYVLAASAHVLVMPLDGKDSMRLLDFAELSGRPTWEGLAMY